MTEIKLLMMKSIRKSSTTKMNRNSFSDKSIALIPKPEKEISRKLKYQSFMNDAKLSIKY